MDIIKDATELTNYLDSIAQEKQGYLKLVTDSNLSLASRLFTNIPFEELNEYVPVAPDKKSVGDVSISLVGRLIRVMDNNGRYKDIPIFGNELWDFLGY